MGLRIAQPDTVKLPLSEGAWVLVRRRLNAGEQHDHFARLAKHADHNGHLELDLTWIGISTIVAYLLDWSLAELPVRGESVEQIVAAVRKLESDDYNELLAAITAHEQAMQAARAEEKKLLAGVSVS
jgi:hypothetical protein